MTVKTTLGTNKTVGIRYFGHDERILASYTYNLDWNLVVLNDILVSWIATCVPRHDDSQQKYCPLAWSEWTIMTHSQQEQCVFICFHFMPFTICCIRTLWVNVYLCCGCACMCVFICTINFTFVCIFVCVCIYNRSYVCVRVCVLERDGVGVREMEGSEWMRKLRMESKWERCIISPVCVVLCCVDWPRDTICCPVWLYVCVRWMQQLLCFNCMWLMCCCGTLRCNML